MLPSQLSHKAYWVPYIAPEVIPTQERKNYVAWIGVLRQPKRPHLLIEIARKLPDVQFIVCGPTSTHRTNAEYAEDIVKQLRSSPNIEYRGQVSPDEAQQVISDAGLFLSTSSQEGFPNTFLQAWSARVPVVSIGVDPGNVIRKWKTGVVVEDIEKGIEVIPTILNDISQNERLGMNGYHYIRQNHNEEFVVKCFMSALIKSKKSWRPDI
jgi:glycosyltransferase involved in cell wall biosynthesis